MTILLLGSGGRESALAWKMAQSSKTDKLYIAPGNGGTSLYGTNVALNPLDFKAVAQFVADNKVNMIVVGNEDPLVAGITDFFKGQDVLVVGPTKAGAMLEGSKDFAKQFMNRHNIPTARHRSFTLADIEEGYKFLESLNAPYVLKADGLAAGKGVIIVEDLDEAKQSLAEMLHGQFGTSSTTVVIEEFLKGIECSVFVLTDSNGHYLILPVAKDYKRVGDGDTGPNTGGMGAVSPVPFADDTFMQKVEQRIIKPTIAGLQKEQIDYKGFIFFGLINVEGNPYVIEYNARMGDPETEAVMLRIESDLVDLLENAARGDLSDSAIAISPNAATTVIAVSKGYPGHYDKGKPITLPASLPASTVIFHAGTTSKEGELQTSGGRVLAISSMKADIEDALKQSYEVLNQIHFDGKSFRTDIGRDLL